MKRGEIDSALLFFLNNLQNEMECCPFSLIKQRYSTFFLYLWLFLLQSRLILVYMYCFICIFLVFAYLKAVHRFIIINNVSRETFYISNISVSCWMCTVSSADILSKCMCYQYFLMSYFYDLCHF